LARQHVWFLTSDGQSGSDLSIGTEKRASIEESSRGTFFRIPAAMPTSYY